MRKFLGVVVLFAVLAVFCGTVQVYAGPGYGRQDGIAGKFFGTAYLVLEHGEYLGLTADQTDQIKNLKLQSKKDLIMQEAQIQVLGLDLKAALNEDKIDIKAVNKLIDKKYDLKKNKVKALVGAYNDLRGILTDDQKKMLDDMTTNGKPKGCFEQSAQMMGMGKMGMGKMGMEKGKCPMTK